MAKGARASSKKANRTKLRARVFGPADKARAERIHAKLLETIQQPKPEKTNMDTTEDATAATKEDDFPKDMDVDGAAKTSTKKGNKDKSQTRKQLRRKSINKISFPASRGKGALKPFTGGRVKKR
ncbi:hypothetical protein HBI56_229970 [Parastagonospora nodorum]|uniref:DUF2423 domain-containing protein n=1 Tax=Phaeosphaeria nodorum (strain SN15 / ATCC MYA-4574 / FGSC 10173) TaxID=321614 RepID=A0A7U2F967_PHANO|nr:hypothetical protein HBH56_201170 [Parastagonospora nodorum]QRD00837.1 hypothetical protein JI435_093610 [Parastagonospora nodorum SN15]KAH3925760.1 hypothetical protein HBH54_175120 [Parastagonospora nodorum]KAH3953065.1 hypothetical protein HBH53_036510 [Parastagonospora nodorum]KAH3976439.1 hypothetical protein HBH52_122160 [Parastagonospora nodorum]